jgi:hypothetical protein
MDISLQLEPQLPPDSDYILHKVQQDIMKDIEEMDNVLTILNNHIILEGMIMKSMAPLADNPINQLILIAYLYAFIRCNKEISNSDGLNRLYLRHIYLYSYAMKILNYDDYPECEFIND